MKIIILISAFVFASSAFAGTSKTRKKHSYLKSFQPSWSLAVGYTRTGARIDQVESSSLSGFSNLGGKSRIGNDNFSLTLMKEFIHTSRLSFTLALQGGTIDGNGSDKIASTQYEGEAAGFHYGGGLTANLNYFVYGVKFQPFVGFDVSIEDIEYRTLYQRSQDIVTQYQYNGTVGKTSLGFRILDEDVGLMSFLKVSYVNPMSEEIESTVKVGDTKGLIEGGEVIRDQISASLGIGFIF